MSDRKCVSKFQAIKNQYKKNTVPLIKPKNKKIRFMLPLSINCKICLYKILRGKKINALKEKILGKSYSGINLLRFYFRCTSCMSGLSIVTDLKELKYNPEINCF